MKLSQSIIAAFGLLSLGAAEKRWANGTVWTTEVVTAYTTFCPSPTTVVANNVTYTVTSATTLTITNCPCTISSVVELTTVASSPSATPVTTTPVPGTTTTSGPSLASNPAVALGSSFGALVVGGAIALML